MQPRPYAVPAEEHHPEKARFQKERCQDFIGQQGPVMLPRELRETAPVGAELDEAITSRKPPPCRKLTAKIFDQKWYSERQVGFLLF